MTEHVTKVIIVESLVEYSSNINKDGNIYYMDPDLRFLSYSIKNLEDEVLYKWRIMHEINVLIILLFKLIMNL